MISLNFKAIDNCNMCSSKNLKVMGMRLNQSQGFNPRTKRGIATSILECENCGLIFSSPQPLPLNFVDQYDVEPDEYWHQIDFDWDPSHFKTELNTLSSLNFTILGKKALDIGAGIGKSMLSMDHAGFESYGFEPTKSFYEAGINKLKISPEKLKCSTIEEAYYPDEYFDFITFGAVLEHLHDPNKSINKVMKWLKPGGYIHIEVPSANWLISKIYNLYYKWICLTNYVTNLSPMHSPYHHFEFTMDSFNENAKQNGYTIAYSNVEVCDTLLPTMLFDGLLKKYMSLTGSGLQLIVFLKKKE